MVADLIRGLSASEAEAQLLLQRRRAAKPLLKLLRSAMANAKNNQREEATQWVVTKLTVDQGPMLKRFLPRARGSASEIQKKMCHVTLTLVESTATARIFTIQPKKKKSRAGAAESKRPRTSTKPQESGRKEEETKTKEQPSFFRKVFNRKSGMGK